MDKRHIAIKKGLYDPRFEHDSCGVGFVCDIKGKKSHEIVEKGIETLERLSHRGAVGADPKTGDGAGILIQLPFRFFVKECSKLGIKIPGEGKFACGLVFLPADDSQRKFCEENFEKVITGEGLELLGWRSVPVDDSTIGRTAKDTAPVFKQILVGCGEGVRDQNSFEVKLYVARKKTENLVRSSKLSQKNSFYIASLSSRTLCYKGLLMPHQLKEFFRDLSDKEMVSCLALVHSRYSTNTFPTWDLAQPFRFLAHNGEINTLRGNINWMNTREKLFKSEILGNDVKKILPVIVPGGSDSAALDNMLELLVLAGRSMPHSLMMLIPAAWQKNDLMEKKFKEFYEYHSCLMEAWDGPAAICFTDGETIGGLLDRNGLRPSRYAITNDGFVVMASEVGVLDIPEENILRKGRLSPGKIFMIDTKEGRIIEDEEIKSKISSRKPYGNWLKENVVDLKELPSSGTEKNFTEEELLVLQKAVGYTREDLKYVIKPMIEKGQEPNGSMGNDTPHAVLSQKPQVLFNYFKQLFAQVTNPPIDPIREETVMSLETLIGPGGNILDEGPSLCRKIRVKCPVITDKELDKICRVNDKGLKTAVVSTLFDVRDPEVSFKKALKRICEESAEAAAGGHSFIVLSDRGIGATKAGLPSLLSTAAVHHHLIREGTRTKVGIIVESAEPREVTHFALLFGYGADCINPYAAFETVKKLAKDDDMKLTDEEAVKSYLKAVEKGLLKILSKMGISLLQSYRGAQIFEAIGLGKDIIDEYFPGTVSRIEGAGLEQIAKETMMRHEEAFNAIDSGRAMLGSGGLYQWKKDGEFHMLNPETISLFRQSVRENDFKKFQEFSGLINDQEEHLCTLRGLMKFKKCKAIPVEEVEPASEIVRRFVTGAMSFGSISKEAHEAMAIAMNRLGGRSNSGEGGEDPERFKRRANGDSVRSSVKQVASGRFGVTSNYLVNADELQIKIAQGAKPGEGGQLPGHKVDKTIARIRYSIPGVTLISPPPHHDIYSIEDLAQLIFDLKNANPQARISVKLVSEIGVGTVAAGVAKGHADMILISGADGGTGASPISSIRHAGLPWELGLSETHQTLVLNDLRSRVRLQTDGQMRTGKDVCIAAILGAEEYGFATMALMSLGCVMLRHCHLNNCSLGIATQDEELRKRFCGKPEYLQNMMNFIAEDVRNIMASLGIKKLDDLVGRTDLLRVDKDMLDWKSRGIDLSKILYKPDVPAGTSVHCTEKQHHGVENVLDIKLISLAKKSIESGEKTSVNMPIRNFNRTTGAMLSSTVSKKYGDKGLPEDTLTIKFTGTAGQSFGAFLARGITFELAGDSNDYVGKGLSGGKIIIYPAKESSFIPEQNIIIGNTTFYGATSGEAYIRGMAGERFCIRNSGASAVVEGVGDHGCEYMTGGRVVVLGSTGRNFGAGMSGGIAYIYDAEKKFKARCNMAMVDLESISREDEAVLKNMLEKHYRHTGSGTAKRIIDDLSGQLKNFIKVMPKEYKAILMAENPPANEEDEEDSEG